jgi:hypothetical protein
MRSRQLQQTWRTILVSALRDRYDLPENEARMKVDKWLQGMSRGTMLYTPGPAPIATAPGNKRRRQGANARRGVA